MVSLRMQLPVVMTRGTPLFSGRAERWRGRQERRLSVGVVRSPYPDIAIRAKTYTQQIWERHGQWAHRTAVECGITGERYTYEELLERAEDLSDGLKREANGHVMAFVLPNCPEYLAAVLGASRAGLTVCSISPLYTPEEIVSQLKSVGARSVVTCPDKLEDVLKAVGQL